MPKGKPFGDPLGRLLAEAGKLPSLPTPRDARAPIQEDKFFRNSMHPNASAMSEISGCANQAVLYRGKEVFRYTGVQGSGLASMGPGDRDRWRFAFHTSPYHTALFGRMVMSCQNASTSYDSYARIDIKNGGGSVVVTQNVHYGVSPLGPSIAYGWQHLKVQDVWLLGLSTDTDYFGTVYDVDYGLTQSISLYECNSLSENGGYLPENFTSLTSITDVHHSNVVTMMKNMWSRGGATILNFTVNDGTSPQQISTATDTNLIDLTSTSPSSSTPGYTLSIPAAAARLSQTTGVPCVMQVYGKVSANAPQGAVKLKDSGGTTIATCSGFGTTAGWVSTTFNMPTGTDKYDLMFSRAATGLFSVYAVSIYTYE